IKENNLDLHNIQIIDPRSAEQENFRNQFGEAFFKKRKRHGITLYDAKKLMRERNYFGAMMIENGNAVYTYLGITEDTRYTAELLETNGYPGGVVVGSVANGSPAEKAGIKTYDIIVEFNGIKVRTMQELQNIKSSLRKGDVVNIKVFRQTSLFRGDYITFDVTLA
ncbi:MAG TPA: phosphate acyltransferase, partial [Clostridia bacterium]|nr:phosphate acyltransferase [Clostridia bacterium]